MKRTGRTTQAMEATMKEKNGMIPKGEGNAPEKSTKN